jgi:hypothetical protein
MAEIQFQTTAKPDPLHDDAVHTSEEELKVPVTVAALPSEVLGQTFALLPQSQR